MSLFSSPIAQLLQGPLSGSTTGPLTVWALLCDLRPRFLPKGRAGLGHRAVARNGRVLLASDRPLAELIGAVARVRLQTWHLAILPGDAPEPYGLLLCARCQERPESEPLFATRMVRPGEQRFDLRIDVGGGMGLEFYPAS